MTNYEKYREEIEKFTDREVGSVNCFIAHEIRKYNGCRTKCNNCILDNLNFLFSDDKEPMQLTRFESDFLKNAYPKCKWIARDGTGDLFGYTEKPIKKEIKWVNPYLSKVFNFTLFNHLFPFVKWEDEEPRNIQELIENCEVIEDD